MAYDLGAVVPVAINTFDNTNALADVTSMALTITQPDGTLKSSPTDFTITHPSIGTYYVDFTPTQVGRHLYRWVGTGANATTYNDIFEVRPFSALPLVSLTDVKRHLNFTGSTNDAELQELSSMATETVEAYLGRPVRRASYVDVFDGGNTTVRLRNTPCVCNVCQQYRTLSITTLTENGTTLSPSDYTLVSVGGLVIRGTTQSRPWSSSYPQNVSVTYVAGYTATPQWARLAVLRLIEHLWQRSQQTPHPVFGDAGGAGDDSPAPAYLLPYSVQSLLNPHRTVGI